MWGAHTGKFVVKGVDRQSRVVARPAKPIPIPGEFDSVEMWGTVTAGAATDKATPALSVAALILEPGQGAPHRHGPTSTGSSGGHPSPNPSEDPTGPGGTGEHLRFEISRIANTEPRYFYCDSLAVFKES
jgi:hypothetical protein